MSAGERLGGMAARLWLAVVLGFLLLPIVNVVAVSFTASVVFDLPTRGLSLRWYARLWQLDSFWHSYFNSLRISALATLIALVLGVLCAVAVARGRFPGRAAIATFVVSPLMLPGLVVGIALLQSLRLVGIYDAFAGLVLANVVVTIPFVTRSVLASLSLFDFTLIEAARTLGCSPQRALLTVLAPNIAPGVLAGGLFAFITSFDNYAVAIFLTDARTKTLPIQMLNYIDEAPDPSMAAISTVLVLMTVAILLVCDRVVGLRRMAAT